MASKNSDTPGSLFRKTFAFDANLYEGFKASMDAMGASAGSFVRKVMQDKIAKRYLNLDLFDEDIRQALTKKSKEMKTDEMQAVVARALREWVERSSR